VGNGGCEPRNGLTAGLMSDLLSQPSRPDRPEAHFGRSFHLKLNRDKLESVLYKRVSSDERRCVEYGLYYRRSRTSDLSHSGHGLSNSAIM
jgi:hypothetical protein